MTASSERFALAKIALANPNLLRVRPDLTLFMSRYMRRFRIKRSGRDLLLHSHLPPLNSPAYARFVSRHLIEREPGPSHAQIAVTNACPQDCAYCYNKQRRGTPMDTETILRVIDELKSLGVCWLGFTGGEPLLQPDLVELTREASGGCAVKLFTTGSGLTRRRAEELAEAGLFSTAVSLDHWRAEKHDAGRRSPGAFAAALDAIAVLRSTPGMHVSVSSVLSRDMIHRGDIHNLLSFLATLEIDEAWLSEVKPTLHPFWRDDLVITEEERLALAAVQDAYNREPGMTVNYLGHFEGAETFGCNAGCKMVYVDAFGEVSPCVFLPMSFGNVRERPLAEIVTEMREVFPGQDRCFINQNYRLLAESGDRLPLGRTQSLELAARAARRPPAAFGRRLRARSRRPDDAAMAQTATPAACVGARP
jgi:MoaA/NifB/PqqE/SkfB family radical SAM enzyme